jgi:DNA-binding NtrC family response regulator
VAATNRDLEREVAQGRFREDLYYRLSAIVLAVPPLRERPLDLPALAGRFAAATGLRLGRPAPSLSPGFVAALRRYPWPGNVRELRNVVERAVVLGDDGELLASHLPERLAASSSSSSGAPTPEPLPATGSMREQVDELEKKSLVRALAETSGNRTHAARKLGISRRALLYKLKKYDLE